MVEQMHWYGGGTPVRVLADETEAHGSHAVSASQRKACAIQLPEEVFTLVVTAL